MYVVLSYMCIGKKRVAIEHPTVIMPSTSSPRGLFHLRVLWGKTILHYIRIRRTRTELPWHYPFEILDRKVGHRKRFGLPTGAPPSPYICFTSTYVWRARISNPIGSRQGSTGYVHWRRVTWRFSKRQGQSEKRREKTKPPDSG